MTNADGGGRPAMADDFMRALHAGYNTPEGVVFDLVARSTGLHPTGREKIVRGYDHEVYAVATREGSSFIVRIRRFGGVSLGQEAWALERCRRAGVPVAEVFWAGPADLNGRTAEVMVQSRLPGRPLADILATLSREQLGRVLRRAGEILRAIHGIEAGGFYRRHDDGSWDFPDWESVAASAIRDRGAEKPLILQAGFGEADFALMMDALRRARDEFPGRRPVLCHGDFLPGHILVDEDLAITGIIDFGDFQGGLPLHDFAYLSYKEPALDLEPLKAGYADERLFDERFDIGLNLYKVGLQMGYLAHYVKTGNIAAVRFAAGQLRKTLDIVSHYR